MMGQQSNTKMVVAGFQALPQTRRWKQAELVPRQPWALAGTAPGNAAGVPARAFPFTSPAENRAMLAATAAQNMARPLHRSIPLDPREARQVEVTARELDRLSTSSPISAVLAAIRSCVPVAAGLLCIIRPDAPDALVSHAVGLPSDLFASWLGTSPDLLAQALKPVVSSKPGGLWRDSETITGVQREQFELLRSLDNAGLGEGAGYKVLERMIPWHGVEHIMLALLMERGEIVPLRSRALLAALQRPIGDAVLRLGLPLGPREPIFAQLLNEQSVGYICISPRGEVLEANQRAHRLVMLCRVSARIEGRRTAMLDFAARAREELRDRRSWYLATDSSTSMLEVTSLRLAKESHALSEDVELVMMKEIFFPQSPAKSLPGLERLTPRQREVALLLARTGDSYKEIADKLSISERTVRKHGESIHRALGVHSRPELTARLT